MSPPGLLELGHAVASRGRAVALLRALTVATTLVAAAVPGPLLAAWACVVAAALAFRRAARLAACESAARDRWSPCRRSL